MGNEDLTIHELIILMGLNAKNSLAGRQKVRIANLDVSDFGKVFNNLVLEVPQQLDLDMGNFDTQLTMMSIAIGVNKSNIYAFIHYMSKTMGSKTELMNQLYSVVWGSSVALPHPHKNDFVEPYEFHINEDGVLLLNIENAMLDVTFLKNIIHKYETFKINRPDIGMDEFLSLVNENTVE